TGKVLNENGGWDTFVIGWWYWDNTLGGGYQGEWRMRENAQQEPAWPRFYTNTEVDDDDVPKALVAESYFGVAVAIESEGDTTGTDWQIPNWDHIGDLRISSRVDESIADVPTAAVIVGENLVVTGHGVNSGDQSVLTVAWNIGFFPSSTPVWDAFFTESG